jgi:hypothetical protein
VRLRPLILPAALLGALGVVLLPAVAQAQVSIDPTTVPTKFTGGWVYAMAIGMTVLGALIAIIVVVSYMRFAPRFQKDEGHTVRAERIVEGREPPRRQVEVREAEPVLVAAPVVQAPAAPAPPAATPQKPAAAAPATAPPKTVPEAAEAPAAPGEITPATPTGPSQPQPGAEVKPESSRAPATETKPAPDASDSPAATGTQTAAPAAPAPAPAASHTGGAEQDQETYDRVLQEQLSKGVDRRVAEGRAKSAAVVAARKKAGG